MKHYKNMKPLKNVHKLNKKSINSNNANNSDSTGNLDNTGNSDSTGNSDNTNSILLTWQNSDELCSFDENNELRRPYCVVQNQIFFDLIQNLGTIPCTTYFTILGYKLPFEEYAEASYKDVTSVILITKKAFLKILEELVETGYLQIETGVGTKNKYYFPKEPFYTKTNDAPQRITRSLEERRKYRNKK